MWYASFLRPDLKSDKKYTLIVLGCRVYGEKASLMLLERLYAASEYLTSHPNTNVILSGGKGPGEDISEAECMSRYFKKHEFYNHNFFIEDKSTSTKENLLFSKKLLDKKQWGNNIIIVTNEFHEYRAHKLAKQLNLNAFSIPGKTAWWLYPTFYIRELYGITYENIKSIKNR